MWGGDAYLIKNKNSNENRVIYKKKNVYIVAIYFFKIINYVYLLTLLIQEIMMLIITYQHFKGKFCMFELYFHRQYFVFIFIRVTLVTESNKKIL